MSIWNFLTYMETSKVNDKLDEANQQTQDNFNKQEKAKINSNISALFQDLYQNNNDIAKVKLDNISNINSFINNEFNKIKEYKQPSRNILWILLFPIFTFLSIKMFMHSGISTIFVFVTFFAVVFGLNILITEKEINNYKQNIKKVQEDLYLYKSFNLNLSAYGLYLKWYLEQNMQDIRSILHDNKNGKFAMYKTIDQIFKIFDLDVEYIEVVARTDNELVLEFNSEIIKLYDRISTEDINKWKYSKYIYNYNLENKANDFAGAKSFISTVNKDYEIFSLHPDGDSNDSISIKDTKNNTYFDFSREGIFENSINMTKDEELKIMRYFFKV